VLVWPKADFWNAFIYVILTKIIWNQAFQYCTHPENVLGHCARHMVHFLAFICKKILKLLLFTYFLFLLSNGKTEIVSERRPITNLYYINLQSLEAFPDCCCALINSLFYSIQCIYRTWDHNKCDLKAFKWYSPIQANNPIKSKSKRGKQKVLSHPGLYVFKTCL